MHPLVSWTLFIAIIGAAYYFCFHKKPAKSRTSRRTEEVVISTKGSALYLGGAGVGSGTDAVTEKKRKKNQKKAPKPQAASQPKAARSSDGSDDNVAKEEDPRESARQLQALKSGQNLSKSETTGSKPSSSTARARQVAGRKANLAPNSPLATASQASSTGADADIDEEGSTPLNSPEAKPVSGADPSDMLEECESPRVLTITPSNKIPRPQKEKKEPSPQPGAQHKKNQKKKEKAKQAREEELAQLRASREQHRAVQRAEEVTKLRSQPSTPAPADPAWTTVNGKKNRPAKESTSEPTISAVSSSLLDTSEYQQTPHTKAKQSKREPTTSTPRRVESEEDTPKTHPSYLDASLWEEIPAHVRNEGEWQEVPSKKLKDRPKSKAAPSESEREEEKPKAALKPAALANISTIKSAPLVRNKSVNGFDALSDDTAGRSSDWAEVDAWDVHPQ